MAGAGFPPPTTALAIDAITGLGTGVATALGVNVGSAGAPVTFNGALGTPSSGTATNLGGTAASLTAGTASAVAVGGVTGLGSNVGTWLATPSGANLDAALTTALGLTKGGTGATSADAALTAFGFPSPLIYPAHAQSVVRPQGPGGNFTLIATTAYFVYLGKTMRATVFKKVRFNLNTTTASTTVGEVGIFTSPLPPNLAGQTLTATAAFSTTLDDLTTAGPQARGNSSDFTTSHAAGLHVWAGIRVNCATGQPVVAGLSGDNLSGVVLTTAAAAAFDGSTGYAGLVPAITVGGTAAAPVLYALTD